MGRPLLYKSHALSETTEPLLLQMDDDDFAFFAPSTKRPKDDVVNAETTKGSRASSFEKTDSSTPLAPTGGTDVETFEGLGIDPWLVSALEELQIHRPSGVQSACIPKIIEGRDVSASAKTGSGKTAAFALPILNDLARESFGNFALVLTPTRELAFQIAEQFQVLGSAISLRICVAVGGLDMMKQAAELAQRPHVVVATPGRLSDLLSSGQVEMRNLRYLVFDEADRLLAADASFLIDEIPTILSRVGGQATSWLFFSATMSRAVADFYRRHRGEDRQSAFTYNGNVEFGTVDTLDQRFMLVPSQVRDAYLVQLLRERLLERTLIVFVGRCKTCEMVQKMLLRLKIDCVALHGQMSQRARLQSLAKFKSGEARRLITTDVGSRGLDIPSAEVVLNFDLPVDARDYVHRVGRVARAGRLGYAISFVHELDIDLLSSIEERLKRKLLPYDEGPKEADVVKILNEVSDAKRTASMELHDRKFGERAQANKKKWAKPRS